MNYFVICNAFMETLFNEKFPKFHPFCDSKAKSLKNYAIIVTYCGNEGAPQEN